ncbi:MAG: SIS domain-containing protein [Bacteroidetes bacterium]|nr:SIS domain-containing protein [Bacteroidota bacterium]
MSYTKSSLNFKEYKNYFIKSLALVNEEEVSNLIKVIINKYEERKTIFVIGNGGSAANASHFAQDLAKGTRKNINIKKRIRALSLTDNVAFITALGNDDGYDTIFEQQLRTFANNGDILIAISGSGNSPNIIKAVEWANENKIFTVGITGYNGGRLKQICKQSVHIELNDMATVESIHSYALHYIIISLMKIINNSPNFGL